MRLTGISTILLLLLLSMSCEDPEPMSPEPDPDVKDLIDISYDPVTYNLEFPSYLGQMEIPEDNPLTEEGVELGRHLFYDPILSADSTMSCSSCHNPAQSFTDNLATSPGIDGILGTRSTMSIINVGFINHGLFWDGREPTLESQALDPVINEIELHEEWPNVIRKFQRHATYPERFRKAFGIEDRDEITEALATKALAQFERTLVSYEAKYDKIRFGTGVFYEEDEIRGRDLFFFELAQTLDHPGCSHCHGGNRFESNDYFNNGITAAADLSQFPDRGLGAITGNPTDNGKFRAPTLRNITLTAPYMHDGRFATLEEVLDHYKSGGHPSPNVNANIKPFTLTEQDKTDLIAFLNTLTDTSFINRPEIQSPF